MLIKSEQLSVGSLIKNVMLKYLFWASYILRLCAQTCTPNRHALLEMDSLKGGENPNCIKAPTEAIASRSQFQNIKSSLFLSFEMLHIIGREVSR